MIRCEKIDVKCWVDTPLHGKLETITDRGHHLDNLLRTMSSGCKLCGWLVGS